MEKLIAMIARFEEKQENGTITFEESKIYMTLIEIAENKLKQN